MDEPLDTLFEKIMFRLRFRIARLAIRFCRFELLYWADSDGWEEYLSVGNPPCRLPRNIWRILSNLHAGSVSTPDGPKYTYFIDMNDGGTVTAWVYGTGVSVVEEEE